MSFDPFNAFLNGFQPLQLFQFPDLSVQIEQPRLSNHELDDMASKVLTDTDCVELKKNICSNYNRFCSFLDYVLLNNNKIFFSKIVYCEPDDINIWGWINKYMCEKDVSLDQISNLDDQIIEQTVTNSAMKILPQHLPVLPKTLLCFNLIDKLQFDNTDDKILISFNTFIKNTSFLKTLEWVVTYSNRELHQGYIDYVYEDKNYLPYSLQHKIMYLLLYYVDPDTDDLSSCIFHTLQTILSNHLDGLFLRRDNIEGQIRRLQSIGESYLRSHMFDDIQQQEMALGMFQQAKWATDVKKNLDNLFECEITNTALNKLFTKFIANNKYNDNTLYTTGVFYQNHPELFSQDTEEFILRVISTKTVTSNPHIRSCFLSIAVDNSDRSELFQKKLTEGCINFFNDTELNKDDSIVMEKQYIRKDVYTHLNKRLHTEQLEDIDPYKIKMFVNFVVRDANSQIDAVRNLLTEYIEIEDDDLYIQQQTEVINIVIQYINSSFLLIEKMSESKRIKDLISSGEILIQLRTMISSSIGLYADFKLDPNNANKLDKIKEFTYTDIELLSLIELSTKLMNCVNKEAISTLFNGGIDREIYKNVLAILMSMDINSDIPIIDIDNLPEEEDTLDYPDDMLDAITGDILHDPVQIPDTDVIVNRGTIVNYIMSDGLNPYNREPLSIEQLDAHNFDLKDKMSAILEKIKKYKQKNN